MAAYNEERYIGRAIESILSQTHHDLELIIGDDASTDETWSIINEYSHRDSRVKAFRNEVNSGATTTLNRAVELASAPVIAGMDSDDIALPYRMKRQLALLDDHPEVVLAGCYVSHINSDDEVLSLSRIGATSVAEFEEMRRRGEPTMALGGTVMYRRRHFDEVGGFDASLRVAGDIEFCDRMAALGPIVSVPAALQLYRVHSSSNVMTRFREGRRTHRFLEARRAALTNHTPVPGHEEYVATERRMPWWRRIGIWRDDSRRFFYRKAGLAFAAGERWKTATYLATAGLIGPGYVLRRLWQQRLSPDARTTRIVLAGERSQIPPSTAPAHRAE
jgi:glycosyltransferase involved in cell wall biosynthesis